MATVKFRLSQNYGKKARPAIVAGRRLLPAIVDNSVSVQFDAVSSGGGANPTSPITWSHTATGSNRAVYIALTVGADTTHNDSNIVITGITYGGFAMTQVGSNIHGNAGTFGYGAIYRLVNPPTGAQTVSLAFTNVSPSAFDVITGASLSFFNVDQTTPDRNFTSVTGLSGTQSLAVSSAVGNMVLDVISVGSAVSTSNTTLRWINNVNTNGSGGNGASSTASGAPSVTVGYTTASDSYALLGIDIVAATPNSNLTVALTGIGMGLSQGSLSYSLSKTLSTQLLSLSQGALSYTTSIPLTGIAANLSQGALSYDLSKTLDSQLLLTSIGTITYSTGTDVNVTLSGIALGLSQGSLTYTLDKALTTQLVTTSQGSVSYTLSKTLTTQLATTSQGNLSYAFSKSLTTQLLSLSQGAITYQYSSALTGQLLSLGQGAITFSSSMDVIVTLTGISMTASQGSLSYVFTKALTGNLINASQGNLTFTNSLNLTGLNATTGQGSLSYGLSKTLDTQILTLSQGTITAATTGDVNVTLTGISMSLSQGTVTFVLQEPNNGGGGGWGSLPRASRRKRLQQIDEAPDDISEINAEIRQLILEKYEPSKKTASSYRAERQFNLPALELPKKQAELRKEIKPAISNEQLKMLLALMMDMM